MELSEDQRFWMVKRRLQGASVVFICQQLGISRDTFYRYWRRFEKEGWKGLGCKSHRPHNIHNTPTDTVEYILQLRKEKGWGPSRIEGHLKRANPKGIKPVGHNTIYRIICRAGLNQPLEEPHKTWGKKRFNRPNPNDLWQADWKLTQEDTWMITFLDDCSRFIPCSRIYENANMKNSLKVLKHAIQQYGKPKQVLTDQGVQFYTWQEDGKTKFTRYLERKEIKHIVASKKRPTTIGKVERFHRSYEEEAHRYTTHQQFIHYYNFERPHQALNYYTPANIYLNQSVSNLRG